MFGPLSLSLAPYVKSSRTLSKWITPLAKWYANAMGYRKYGFKYDDLIVEENDQMQRALTRLTRQELYDRAWRMKRASQASVLHAPLPKEQWTPESEDTRYLEPHVQNVVRDDKERKDWDTLVVERK